MKISLFQVTEKVGIVQAITPNACVHFCAYEFGHNINWKHFPTIFVWNS